MKTPAAFIFIQVLLVTQAALGAESSALVKIDPGIKYQTIEGYGHGNMEQNTPVWYAMYSAVQIEEILDTVYTLKNGGLGLNIYRYLMPTADSPDHKHMRRLPSMANKPFEYQDGKFNWDGHEDVLWMAAGAVKRGAKLWASWYAIPYWLSVSGCASGSQDGKINNLPAGKEKRFIKHIVDVMDHFKNDWGIEFQYVSPVNEPEADWWKAGGGQPGSHVSSDQAITLYRELHKALRRNNHTSKLIAYDAAYTNTTAYLNTLLESDIKNDIDVLACHQYITSEPALKNWAKTAHRNRKSLWMSEWGDWTNTRKTQESQVKQMVNYANKLHEAFDVLQANAWIMWEAGFIFDTTTTGLKKRKSYWAIAHYSRHARPSFYRIKAQCEGNKDVKTTAWLKSEDNSNASRLVLVTVNSGETNCSVKYDFSRWHKSKVMTIRQTSADKNYEKLPPPVNQQSQVALALPGKSITTIDIDTFGK